MINATKKKTAFIPSCVLHSRQLLSASRLNFALIFRCSISNENNSSSSYPLPNMKDNNYKTLITILK